MLILNVLQLYPSRSLSAACGMGLRAGDPASMKEFVVSVQQRTSELKASLSSKNGGIPVDLGKRVGLLFRINNFKSDTVTFDHVVVEGYGR